MKNERIEMFRISPELNKYYEYAEYTYKEGNNYRDQKYFVTTPPKYVGTFIKREEGGYGDGSWRIDYFQDEKMNKIAINYSYEGRTCFREVSCKPIEIPSLFNILQKCIKENIDYSNQDEFVKNLIKK
jgi:hypothetical protein